MKRRINLLSITFTKRKFSEQIGAYRLRALFLLGVCIIAGIVEFFIYTYLQNQIKINELSKTTLEQYVGSNESFEKKIKYFFYKYNLLNTYLKEDANGYIFYNRVKDLIAQTAPTAQITSFSYKNNGETSFTLQFDSYNDASGFIASLESPVYLDVFQFVQIQGFDAADRAAGSQFDITIFAQFIQPDEN